MTFFKWSGKHGKNTRKHYVIDKMKLNLQMKISPADQHEIVNVNFLFLIIFHLNFDYNMQKLISLQKTNGTHFLIRDSENLISNERFATESDTFMRRSKIIWMEILLRRNWKQNHPLNRYLERKTAKLSVKINKW